MSKFTQVSLPNPAGGSPIVVDVGALASNVTFADGSDLQSSFVPFTGADASNAGTKGLVPAPSAGDEEKFLKADGTWGTPAGGVSSVNGKTGIVTLDASDVGAIASTEKGAASGVAELDANGKVPSAQLPSYVDDVIEGYYNTSDGKFYEEDTYTTEIPGETGKIYVSLDTNKSYRWGGSAFVEISESLALGETDSTAYRGDRGKVAYDHATDSSAISSAVSSGLYKVAGTAEGHIASLTAVEKSDITALGIPAQDTTYTASTTSVGSASSWSAGSMPTFTMNGTVLEITDGTAPSLTVTDTTVATGITANS